MTVLWSLFLFVLAGLAEIGGGYLVWQWLRGGSGVLVGVVGGIFIVMATFGGGRSITWNPTATT